MTVVSIAAMCPCSSLIAWRMVYDVLPIAMISVSTSTSRVSGSNARR